MKKLSGIVVIIVIFGVSIYLITQIPRSPKESSGITNDSNPGAVNTEEWLGVFLQGQRIGYSFTKISESDTGFTVENRSKMTLLMMNETRTLTTRLFAHTDKDYTLKDFVIEIETAGHSTKVEGEIKGKNLTLTAYSQGTPYTRTITLKEKPYFPEALEQVIKKKKLKPGDELTIPYFDPTTQSSTSATLKVFDKEEVEVAGKKTAGTRIELEYLGMKSLFWIDDDYNFIKQATPAIGLEMIPLTKEQALVDIQPTEAFDLLSFFAVKPDKRIPPPDKLSYLKIALKNISIEGLNLNDDYQKMTVQKPVIIESFLADINELPEINLPIKEQSEFLKPSVYIQCEDPRIIAKARELVGGETEAKKAVAKLVQGVYNFLKKNPIASLPSAVDVLKTREGDCNEHAILFAALARAEGIPTKIYAGLINLQGVGYYYHAWCGVWLGKWVPVDPTFNQFPADVGHLKLIEGGISEQAKVLKVVGKLEISILDYTEK